MSTTRVDSLTGIVTLFATLGANFDIIGVVQQRVAASYHTMIRVLEANDGASQLIVWCSRRRRGMRPKMEILHRRGGVDGPTVTCSPFLSPQQHTMHYREIFLEGVRKRGWQPSLVLK